MNIRAAIWMPAIGLRFAGRASADVSISLEENPNAQS